MNGDTGVILAAAGAGSRCQTRRYGKKKQFLELRGRPLVHWCLDALATLEDVSRIVVVLPQSDLEFGRALLESWRRARAERGMTAHGEDHALDLTAIAGGSRRQDSVLEGLRFLRGSVRYALVHDAARPLVTTEEAARVLDAIRQHGAAVLGTPLTDSVKKVRDGQVVETLDRATIWTVQTPQGAILEELLSAYEKNVGSAYTDEASALKDCGFSVAVVKGSTDNMKITHEEDIPRVERLLGCRELTVDRG
jgi:2-C-methyl-D-erythritol 4-phosphate cytidylyltransferase